MLLLRFGVEEADSRSQQQPVLAERRRRSNSLEVRARLSSPDEPEKEEKNEFVAHSTYLTGLLGTGEKETTL